MIRRPPRSTLDRSSAASDVYKRQAIGCDAVGLDWTIDIGEARRRIGDKVTLQGNLDPVSYTHLRAHETVLDLVCRLLLEKKKKKVPHNSSADTRKKKESEQP